MGTKRGREWLINTFLWVWLLGAVAGFVAYFVISCPVPLPTTPGEEIFPTVLRRFVLPSSSAWFLLASAMLLSFVVAVVKRRLLGMLAAFSIVVCLLVVSLWIRSYWWSDQIALVKLGARGDDTLSIRGFNHDHGRTMFASLQLPVGADADSAGYFPPDVKSLIMLNKTEADNVALTDLILEDIPPWLRKLGFGMKVHSNRALGPNGGGVEFALAMPHWFLCLLSMTFPFVWLLRHRRRRRRLRRITRGQCAVCGYDLRATPDPAGGRLSVCPECGTRTQAAVGNSTADAEA